MPTSPPLFSELLAAILAAAKRWADPAYPARLEAVEATLALPNRFTEAALTFAINQQLAELTEEGLLNWIAGRRAATPQLVGVLNPGNIPFVGLQDWLAVVLAGHGYRGVLSSRSPYLLPAFIQEVWPEDKSWTRFTAADDFFEGLDYVIASGSDETMAWVEAASESAGIPSNRLLLRGHRYSVAIISGQESESEREQLAEDALLHEGRGCRNVAIIWAPASVSPDPYLEAMAQFRGVFPAPDDTSGRLKMQQAFLAAVDAPHGYADDLSFLMSKGEPEPQGPCHIRWTPYQNLEEVQKWLFQHESHVQAVFAPSNLIPRIGGGRVAALGEAQRPPLHWQPDGIDTVEFLTKPG